MWNIYNHSVSERKKKFDESLEALPTESPITTEAMMRELAILRKGYYDPCEWGFPEEDENESNKS